MDYSHLNENQRHAVEIDNGPMMILAGAGSGKALVNGTNILTRGGYLPIEKLRVGTKVYGSDGNTHKVLGVYPQGRKKVNIIKFFDGTEIKCCEDHLWTIGLPTGETKTYNTKKLKTFKMFKDGKPQYFVPAPYAIQFPEQPVSIDSYLLGLVLGLGRFLKNGIYFNFKTDEVKEKFFEEFKKNNISLIHVEKETYKADKTLASLLEEVGIFKDKLIPKQYKINNVTVRRSLLMGFIDAVGINKGSYYEFPVAKELMNDLQFIVESLGYLSRTISSNISTILNGQKVNKQVNKIVVYPNKKFINKLHTLPSKTLKGEFEVQKKYITGIKELEKYEKMTCIQVDSDDKLFLTERFTLTHNTTVLVHKVAHMIENGTDPKRILLLTFTNKAADEMMERINKLLGGSMVERVQGGTYHSFCADLLRRNADEIGFDSNFTICDAPDSAEIINLIKERIGYKKEDNLPNGKTLSGLFSYCLNQGKDIAYAIANKYTQCEGKEAEIENIRDEYILYKYNNNILDYDDLLLQANMVLEGNPELCKRISSFFKYILVDEYQDSNRLQMELLMKLRQFDNKNICIVGDPEQCVVKGTLIKTNSGIKKVEDLTKNDKILSASGRGGLLYASIAKINKKKLECDVFTIETEHGHKLSTTKDHIIFANTSTKNKYFVYLMENADAKFKLGVYNSNIKANETAYRVICDRENGSKLWVIDTTDNFDDAKSIMDYFSVKYKISAKSFINTSTIPFSTVQSFLNDNNIFYDYPTYVKSYNDGSVFKINYTLFGDTWIGTKRNFYKSLLVADSLNKEGIEVLSKALETDVCNRHQAGQKDRFIVKKIGMPSQLSLSFKTLNTLKELKEFSPIFIENAFITADKTSFVPACMLKPGMKVCVFDGKQIVLDTIVKVSKVCEETEIYDIDVDKLHNFFANNICVHNCIYGFRGSRYENILEFPNAFPGCEIVKLNENYRSNQEILDLSNELTSGSGVFENKLVGQKSIGYKPKIVNVATQTDEATWVLRKIEQYLSQGVEPRDIAVLARGSNDSSALEAKLFNIDYNKYGGIKFWERESTKNVLSFLKVLNNYKDEISWFRILKLYPNIGSVNAKKLTEGIVKNGYDELLEDKYSKKQYHEYLLELHNELDLIQNMDLTEKIRYVIDEYYQKVMRRSIGCRKIKDVDKRNELRGLDDDIERLQNLIELSKGYKSLNSYINDLLLDTSQSNYKENAVTISTIHSAKGLEWKVVFILDCVDSKFPTDKGPSAFTEEALKEHAEELAEEQRIFYVAVTRCKEDLYLMYPQYNYYSQMENDLSRYLAEDNRYKTKCEAINYF